MGINVDSLWLINERAKGGKRSNFYHGNFVPQVPSSLISRYTKENDVVMDLFMGSGTTLFECEALHRKFIGFDINEEVISAVREKMADNPLFPFCINNCDVTDTEKVDRAVCENFGKLQCKGADFLIVHPPYWDIVKFTEKVEDLSRAATLDDFIVKFIMAMSNALRHLKVKKYFAIIIGDIYKNSEVVPLGFYLMESIKKRFDVKLKGIVIKNIEGNRGKLGVNNIWRARAERSDYFLFKHEYIFVFKKES